MSLHCLLQLSFFVVVAVVEGAFVMLEETVFSTMIWLEKKKKEKRMLH